jgi:hypothetical protein
MMKSLLLYWVILFHPQEELKPLVEHKTPLAGRVAFTIASERADYFVLEPLKLTMAFRNESDEEVTGVFSPDLGSGNLTVFYRREGREFEKYTCHRQERPRHVSIFLPQSLKPQQEFSKAEEILVLDTKKGRFVFEEPGVYEFKAVYRDLPNESNGQLESNVLRVKVEPAPENEQEAIRFYKNESIGLLVQNDFHLEDSLERAVRFLDKYPASVYAAYVRDGLLWGLGNKVQTQKATKAEYELYERLRQEDAEKLYWERLGKPKP